MTTDLAARDRANIIHPYLPASSTERVVMTEGRGSRLWDTEGREYIDATGGLWLAQIGHGRAELADAARAQMAKLEYFTSFWEFSNEPAIELAERLVSISPAHLERVYFTSGGSEGNEAAIKMARYYHHRRGDTNRTWILGRDRGYHGGGIGGSSVNGFSLYHEGFGPMMPDVLHLTPPWPYRTELFDGQDCTDFCVAELERTIAELGAENIAAMLAEPIMGVGGMIVPPADYWPRIAEVLHRNGILLIFDEVVTAYGRLGSWFAAEHFGVRPDIVVTAKGITSGYLPLGAVLTSGEVGEVLGREHGFPVGYTYNGHPTACAVALANLNIIEREGLLERATKIGDFLAAELRGELGELARVGEVRNQGMMLAVELVTDRESRQPLPGIQQIADTIRADNGVIVRDAATALVLSPALTLSEEEASAVARAIGEVLARTEADGTVRPRGTDSSGAR
ncbi:aspartate aminotransferase family protein [Sciscionella sediminilitoris]|uniref:aminotransferase family protein n=1 Tax=Sciscionella sediminilitoris TaxID=1445613 RepID=UPI0004DF2776|nr:aspartate aminotransferase family protein [Sciscionella sp. SE31]